MITAAPTAPAAMIPAAIMYISDWGNGAGADAGKEKCTVTVSLDPLMLVVLYVADDIYPLEATLR